MIVAGVHLVGKESRFNTLILDPPAGTGDPADLGGHRFCETVVRGDCRRHLRPDEEVRRKEIARRYAAPDPMHGIRCDDHGGSRRLHLNVRAGSPLARRVASRRRHASTRGPGPGGDARLAVAETIPDAEGRAVLETGECAPGRRGDPPPRGVSATGCCLRRRRRRCCPAPDPKPGSKLRRCRFRIPSRKRPR